MVKYTVKNKELKDLIVYRAAYRWMKCLNKLLFEIKGFSALFLICFQVIFVHLIYPKTEMKGI